MQTRIQRTLKTIKPAPSLRARRARSRDRHTRARHGRPRVEHRIDPARGARRDAANRDQARRRAQGATATRPTRRPRAIATFDAMTTIDRDARDERTNDGDDARRRRSIARARRRADRRASSRRRRACGRTRASRHDRSIDRGRGRGVSLRAGFAIDRG